MSGVVYSAMNGIQPSLYGEMFPTRVRLSGMAIGTQIGFAIGGFAPTAAAAIDGDGTNWVPVAAYVLVSQPDRRGRGDDRARDLQHPAAGHRRARAAGRRGARSGAARAHGDGGVLTQRKPTWLMPVSIICGRRAAGR